MKAKEEEWLAIGHVLYQKKKKKTCPEFRSSPLHHSFQPRSYQQALHILFFPHLCKPTPGSQKLSWICWPQVPQWISATMEHAYKDNPQALPIQLGHNDLVLLFHPQPLPGLVLLPLLPGLPTAVSSPMVSQTDKLSHSTLLPLPKSTSSASISKYT